WWDGFKMRHDTPPSIFTDRKPVESFVTFQTPSVLDKSRNGEKILIENKAPVNKKKGLLLKDNPAEDKKE
ncbi:MAG: hypothetical protein HY958_04495, partial [Bacteroidia bacterium]|nr:hypothetical protein [Bacteroidia bacterium]